MSENEPEKTPDHVPTREEMVQEWRKMIHEHGDYDVRTILMGYHQRIRLLEETLLLMASNDILAEVQPPKEGGASTQ